MTEVTAKHLRARISDQKCRIIAAMIQGKMVDKALSTLNFTTKKGAQLMKKVLESAIANAENNEGLDVDRLRIARICVNRGPMLKRFHARGRGRGNRIIKRSSHISITVTDQPAKIA